MKADFHEALVSLEHAGRSLEPGAAQHLMTAARSVIPQASVPGTTPTSLHRTVYVET